MALDRQKILNELGSVMNQLQSADCGCMGKLFQQPGQNPQSSQGYTLPTCRGCRRGYCHGHGNTYNAVASCGEPYVSSGQQNMHHHCMGRCNPPKLYADTYNYLNSNLMQPVVKEVYDDLKSITPANTLPNNPLATQMGLTQGKTMDMGDNNMTTQKLGQGSPQNAMQNMHGMGPQIMNMLGGSTSKPNYTGQPSQPSTGILDMNAQQNMSSNMTPILMPHLNQENIKAHHMAMRSNTQNANPVMQPTMTQNPAIQPTINQNSVVLPTTNANPATQQMAAPSHSYGQHSQGMTKFKEMFPGVVQGVGGKLGFDPMTIAIQMNPANHQRVAMEYMHKIMDQKPGSNKMLDRTENCVMTPQQSIPSADTLPQNFSNAQENVLQNQVPQKEIPANETPSSVTPNQVNTNRPQPSNQQYATNQQAYPVVSENLTLYPQQMQPALYQTVADPNALPTIYEGTGKTNSEPREPLLPVDKSKYQTMPQTQNKYEYNTLGQPIEMLPATFYHTPEPILPQTLSPQPISRTVPVKYSNVKSTVSKTSLVGNRPVGRTPSRSQLQNIYNQYKGSQSYTQQNIRPSDGISHSDGRLNLPQTNTQQVNQVPIEKTGGDTIANNETHYNKPREQVMGQIGDVPGDKKPEALPSPENIPSNNNRKGRNGLQDMVYTSYPISTSWTFHGRDTYSAGYRYRGRI